MNTQRLRKLVVIGQWMLCVGAAHADGFCGPGAYDPNNGRAPAITCVPIRGYEEPAPQPSPQQWVRRWGAVAIDSQAPAVGVSTDKSSKQEASQTAMSGCLEKGGKHCELEAVYDNECVAVVEGDRPEGGAHNTPTAATANEAVATGMKTCRNAGNTNCRVFYSACSLPVRIR